MKICPLCFERSSEESEHCPRDTTPLLPLGDPRASPLIGKVAAERFLLLDLIGRGGMGSVFRGYQLSMSRMVAVKVLSRPDQADPVVIERFIREARSTAQLRCPHTIVVYDFGQLESGELFMAMELLSGPTLEAVTARERRLPPERAARLAAQVCMSLEEAHELGMIHRDIKPRNIIIENEGTRDERVKVLDFGLVKLVENPDFALTREGVIHGTPPYMAPEMWSDAYGGPSPATDLYALGVSMFEMLAGRLPFRGTSMPGFARMHCFDPIPALPGSLEDQSLAKLQQIIHRCLDKEPERRYPSAQAMRLALESFGSIEIPQADLHVEREPVGLADTIAYHSTPAPARSLRPVLTILLLALASVSLYLLRSMYEDQPLEADPIPILGPPVLAAESPKETTIERPRASAPRPPKRNGSKIGAVTVAGSLPQVSAERAVADLSRDLERCVATAYGKRTARISVHSFVRPDGSTAKVRVSPNDDAGARFRTCFEPIALQKRFDPFDGPFSTVTVVLTQ